MPIAVLLAGWGVKESSRFKTWKRRYFVLREATDVEAKSGQCTHVFLYYKSQKHAMKFNG